MRRPLAILFRYVGLAGLAVLGAGPAAAHPNVFATLRVLFDMKGTEVARIGQSWTFDPAYSATLLQEYDKNRDGKIDPGEARALIHDMTRDLTTVRYFTYVSYKGEDLGPLTGSELHPVVQDGLVTLAFWLTLPPGVDVKRNPIDFQVNDPSFFLKAKLADKGAISLRGIDRARCDTRVVLSKDDIELGQLVDPQRVLLTCPR